MNHIRSTTTWVRRVGAVVVCATLAAACAGADDASEDDANPVSASPTATQAAVETTSDASSPADASGDCTEPSGDPVVVGYAVGLTGFLGAYEGPVTTMAQIKVDEVNCAGGVLGRPLEIVTRDNRSQLELVQSVAEELLDEGVDFIHSDCDYDFGSPAVRAAAERDVLALGCASAPEFGLTGLGKLAFNTFQASATEAASMAQLARDQGWETAHLLVDNTLSSTVQVCSDFEFVFTELGGEVVGTSEFANDDLSISPQIGEIQQTTPDAVVLCSYLPGGGSAVKQVRASSDVPIVGQLGMEGTFWLDCCPGLSDFYAVALASIAGDDPVAARADIVAAYEERTGESLPFSFALLGYNGIELLTEAVERAGTTDGPAVAEAWESLQDFETALGPTTYSADCHIPLGRPMVGVRIVGGELEYVGEIDPQVVPESIC